MNRTTPFAKSEVRQASQAVEHCGHSMTRAAAWNSPGPLAYITKPAAGTPTHRRRCAAMKFPHCSSLVNTFLAFSTYHGRSAPAARVAALLWTPTYTAYAGPLAGLVCALVGARMELACPSVAASPVRLRRIISLRR